MRERMHQLLAAGLDLLPEEEWPRMGRWIGAVVVLSALFWGGLAGAEAVSRLSFEALTAGTALRVSTGEARLEWLPPGVRFSRLTLSRTAPTGSQQTVQLDNARLTLGLAWPLRPVVRLQAELFNGTLEADAALSRWLAPEHLNLDARWKNLNPRAIQTFFNTTAGIQFVDVLGGRLSGVLSTATSIKALSTAPFQGKGQLSLELDGARAASGIPLLKPEVLKDVAGRLLLDWNNNDLRLREVLLMNPVLHLEAQGTARAERSLQDSTLQIRVRLTVPPDQLRLLLLPQRSQQAFVSGKPVDVLLSGSAGKPVFGLATSPPTTEARP